MMSHYLIDKQLLAAVKEEYSSGSAFCSPNLGNKRTFICYYTCEGN